MTKSPVRRDDQPSIESRTARSVLVIVLIAFGLWLSVQLRVILVDVIIAITIASAISPLATFGEKRQIARGWTVLVTYIVVIAFYATILFLLWAPIKEQTMLLVSHFPSMLATATDWYNQQLGGLGFASNFKVTSDHLQTVGRVALNKTVDVSLGVFGVILNTVLVLFLAAYFVVNSQSIWAGLLKWVPTEHRARVASLIGPVGQRMGGYVRGQALVSTAIAAFFAIGLSLLGVRYGLVLGLVAGILNLVPFVGSLITTALAVLVAFNQSPTLALLTLGLFVLEQVVESNFIVPYLLGSQVELDPLVVLFAILTGATLGGGVGALIAVPIAAAMLLLARELYLKPMQEQESVLVAPPST